MTQVRAAATPARARLRWSISRDLDQNLLVLIVMAVAALAWVLLAVTHADHSLSSLPRTGEAAGVETLHSGHGRQPRVTASETLTVLAPGILAVAGWIIMVVAMMLPPALPLLQMVRKLAARRWDVTQLHLTYLAALTFVAVWTIVGVVLVIGDLGVRALWAEQGWASSPHVISGAVLIGAGLYQFSPLKNACLRACRSPRSFALAHWRGQRSAQVEVVTLSGAYAFACVGCCWALMLVCFAVGTAALPVMVVLAVLMTAERLVRWGRRLVRPVGLCLLVLGTATMLHLPPTDLLTL